MEDPLSSDTMERFASIYPYAVRSMCTLIKYVINYQLETVQFIYSFIFRFTKFTKQHFPFRGDKYSNENIDIYV